MKNTWATHKYIYVLTILIINILILISSAKVIGKNYYFSSSTGDDTRTALQAQNSGTPWKTLTKLNSFFPSLAVGDSILFKRGDVFTGTIIISRSGSAGSPIVLAAFGYGANPIITGFHTISGWTDKGGNIWESSVTACKNTLNLVPLLRALSTLMCPLCSSTIFFT